MHWVNDFTTSNLISARTRQDIQKLKTPEMFLCKWCFVKSKTRSTIFPWQWHFKTDRQAVIFRVKCTCAVTALLVSYYAKILSLSCYATVLYLYMLSKPLLYLRKIWTENVTKCAISVIINTVIVVYYVYNDPCNIFYRPTGCRTQVNSKLKILRSRWSGKRYFSFTRETL